MAVSATGTGFNATILDYKDWLESQSPEDIDALGRELAKQTTNNKKGVRFFYDTVDRTIVFAAHSGRTAVQGYFKRSEYEEADDKYDYVEHCISMAIVAYMELVNLQNKSTGFWRHNYNQGLVVHDDVPHLSLEDIIDIASRSIDDETLDAFASTSELDLQWYLSIEDRPTEYKANSKRLYEQWTAAVMHASNDGGAHLARLNSRFSLDADKLYESIKEWRLFNRTDGTYYYHSNPLVKIVKIIDLLGVDDGGRFIEILAKHFARTGGHISDLVAIKVLLERIGAKAELIVTGAEFKSSLQNPLGVFSGLYSRTGVDPAEVREITLAPKRTDSLRAMDMANRLASSELPKATISMEPTTLAVIHAAAKALVGLGKGADHSPTSSLISSARCFVDLVSRGRIVARKADLSGKYENRLVL